MKGPRERAALRQLLLVAFAGVAFSILSPPWVLFEPSQAPTPGVQVAKATSLVKTGVGGVPAADLAFLAITPESQIVATDRQSRRLVLFSPTGQVKAQWGPHFGANVELMEPAGVAATNGEFLIVDRGPPPRVVRINAHGAVLRITDLQSMGTYGLNGVAVDPSGNAYVADTGRNRLIVISPEGRVLREVGSGGKGLGQFVQPMAMAFADDGALYVADWENARLQRFDQNLAATHAWSTGFRSFGVAVDAVGRVFAPDSERRRVRAFTPYGETLAELGGENEQGLDVSDPRQVAFGPDGTLYVLGRNGIVQLTLVDTAPVSTGSRGNPLAQLDLTSATFLAAVSLIASLVIARQRRRAKV